MKFLRKLPYWYLLAVPMFIFSLGLASNQSVLIANHGKFPVMLNEAQVVKFCSIEGDPDEIAKDIPAVACERGGQMIDETYSIMGPNSHLKALSDIFPLGDAIYSVGDALLFLGSWLFSFAPFMWIALVVRKLSLIP